ASFLPLETGLDATVRLAHGIRPFRARKLRAHEIEPRLQRRSAFRSRKSLDPVRDLGKSRLRNGDIAWFSSSEARDHCRTSFHQGRNSIRVQNVAHRSCGRFERRARLTSPRSSSTAATVSRPTLRSFSRNSGVQPDGSFTARSSARTMRRLRLTPSALARRSTDFKRASGIWTVVGMRIYDRIYQTRL